MNKVNWCGSLKNKFDFSDHSFTHLAVARWQDEMSRGQKSWFFFNFPRSVFVHFWTMYMFLERNVGVTECPRSLNPCTQSLNNGHLSYHCSFYCRAHRHGVSRVSQYWIASSSQVITLGEKEGVDHNWSFLGHEFLIQEKQILFFHYG